MSIKYLKSGYEIGDLVELDADNGIYAHFNVFPVGPDNIPDPSSNERIDFFTPEIYLYLGIMKWHEKVFDMVLFSDRKYVLVPNILMKAKVDVNY